MHARAGTAPEVVGAAAGVGGEEESPGVWGNSHPGRKPEFYCGNIAVRELRAAGPGRRRNFRRKIPLLRGYAQRMSESANTAAYAPEARCRTSPNSAKNLRKSMKIGRKPVENRSRRPSGALPGAGKRSDTMWDRF